MKIRLLALTAVIALTLASFMAVASAQSYGDQSEGSTSTESTDSVTETEGTDTEGTETVTETEGANTNVQVQTDEDAEDETEEGTEEGSERNRRHRGHRGGCSLEAAATAIGIDEADLRAAIDEGQTIADVAEANGVAVDTVITAMVDAKAERLAEKVESGRITQDEADEKLANAQDRISDRVNGVDDDQAEA